jgi:hypothetical protein
MKPGADATTGPTTAHGTHEVSSAIGRVKTRFPALKVLTEVHVPHESAPGPPRSRGLWQRARYTADQRMSGVAVDRRPSLLFSCFSWLSVCSTWICERRNIARGTTPCVRGSSDGTRLEDPPRLIRERWDFPSSECALFLRLFNFHVVDSGN